MEEIAEEEIYVEESSEDTTVPVAEDVVLDEPVEEISPDVVLANSTLNPEIAEFVPELSVDESVIRSPDVTPEIVADPDETLTVVVPEVINISDDEQPDENADNTIIDPAEETYPYEEADALIFDDTWFENQDSDHGGEADRDSNDSSMDEVPVRRSTRSRVPKMVSSHAKPGGEIVLVPVGTDK